MSQPFVVAQSGPKELEELRRVLHRAAISAQIVCPPGENGRG